MRRTDVSQLGGLVASAKTILLLQPDKPDGDSLGSMLALEEIFGQLDKKVIMYTAGRVEPYLHHLPGHDRVRSGDDWPSHWDLAILMDTGAPDQVARLLGAHHAALSAKPWVLIDHHGSRTPISGVTLELFDAKSAATGEMLYRIARALGWPLTPDACSRLVAAIFADTLNLTTPSTGLRTVATYAALVRLGKVNVSALHQAFREASANDPDLLIVKGQLLQSLELFADGRVAIITVSPELIAAYRERTSLSSLVLYELLWARGVQVAAVMSDYGDIIRTSLRARVPVVGKVATSFGGGGHPMAAAFGVTDTPLDELKQQLVERLTGAL